MRQDVQTLADALKALTRSFSAAGLDTPALDARWLIAGALGLARATPLLEPDRELSRQDVAVIGTFEHRRLAREPVARILGVREFYGLDLLIGPSTLDPRPDTEILVEGVLELMRPIGILPGKPIKILDLGTGSGAILIALLRQLPGAIGVGTDIDPNALAIAAENARRLGVADRFSTCKARWLDGITGHFDVIVSNPPYIPAADIAGLAPEVAAFEPLRALDGGFDGLDAYREIVPAAAARLAPRGWLALEVGLGQDTALLEILSMSGSLLDPSTAVKWPDLTGRTRCVAIQSRA